MTPQQYQKIKAIADDERGDPATRALAKAKLAAYYRDHPQQQDNAMKFQLTGKR